MEKKITIYKKQSEVSTADKIKQAAVITLAIEKEKRNAQLEGISYTEERERFLRVHESRSKQTARTYRNALKVLEEYTNMYNLNILDLKAQEADDFVIALKMNKKLANNTIDLIVAGCSSFFTHLERNYIFVRNAFRGTKTRPHRENKKMTLIPSKKEMDFIIRTINSSQLKAAIIFIRETGVRVGALQGITIIKNSNGYIYKSFSKGHEVKGLVSPIAIKTLTQSKLNINAPFQNMNNEVVRTLFYRHTKKLCSLGQIKNAYSVHDIRHYFAVTQYTKDKDIYRLKKLLCHSNISITEKYLKSMDLEA